LRRWCRVYSSSNAPGPGPDIKRTRNIGIIAHIDAVSMTFSSSAYLVAI
jgi:hypothetical protein